MRRHQGAHCASACRVPGAAGGEVPVAPGGEAGARRCDPAVTGVPGVLHAPPSITNGAEDRSQHVGRSGIKDLKTGFRGLVRSRRPRSAAAGPRAASTSRWPWLRPGRWGADPPRVASPGDQFASAERRVDERRCLVGRGLSAALGRKFLEVGGS